MTAQATIKFNRICVRITDSNSQQMNHILQKNVNDLNRAHWLILLMKHTETIYNPEVSSQYMIQTRDILNAHEQSIIDDHATRTGFEFKTVVRIKANQTRQTKH